MYFDLSVPYTANHGELQRTLAFLSERQSFRDLAHDMKMLTFRSGL